MEQNNNFNEVLIDTKTDKIDNISTLEGRSIASFENKIGEEFFPGDALDLTYIAPNGDKINYSFDILNNKIIINNSIYSVKPLEGIKISKIEFRDNKIVIHGIMGIVEGKMEASYKDTTKSIDEIYNYILNNK